MFVNEKVNTSEWPKRRWMINKTSRGQHELQLWSASSYTLEGTRLFFGYFTRTCMRGQKRRNSVGINCDQFVPRHAVGSIVGFIKFYSTDCNVIRSYYVSGKSVYSDSIGYTSQTWVNILIYAHACYCNMVSFSRNSYTRVVWPRVYFSFSKEFSTNTFQYRSVLSISCMFYYRIRIVFVHTLNLSLQRVSYWRIVVHISIVRKKTNMSRFSRPLLA